MSRKPNKPRKKPGPKKGQMQRGKLAPASAKRNALIIAEERSGIRLSSQIAVEPELRAMPTEKTRSYHAELLFQIPVQEAAIAASNHNCRFWEERVRVAANSNDEAGRRTAIRLLNQSAAERNSLELELDVLKARANMVAGILAAKK